MCSISNRLNLPLSVEPHCEVAGPSIRAYQDLSEPVLWGTIAGQWTTKRYECDLTSLSEGYPGLGEKIFTPISYAISSQALFLSE